MAHAGLSAAAGGAVEAGGQREDELHDAGDRGGPRQGMVGQLGADSGR